MNCEISTFANRKKDTKTVVITGNDCEVVASDD